MDEFQLIRRYFTRAGGSANSVELGIGDDCALLTVPAGQQLAVSIDTVVAGVHFPVDTPARHVATRALCTALSDLAAMGAQPLWITLALTLPKAEATWLADFSHGLFDVMDEFNLALVGGDTTKGPLTVSIQVHGALPYGQALRRSGARAGDSVYVTGTLGDGAAALALIRQQLTVSPAATDYLLRRFYRPQPQIIQGQKLLDIASSCIDISDGLLADLGHVCAASGVGAQIDVSRLPIADGWRLSVGSRQGEEWALTGGDDYQLCFTVPQERQAQVNDLVTNAQLDATAIGTIKAEPGITLVKDGATLVAESKGYNHFDA